jgi:hypothetical protein
MLLKEEDRCPTISMMSWVEEAISFDDEEEQEEQPQAAAAVRGKTARSSSRSL